MDPGLAANDLSTLTPTSFLSAPCPRLPSHHQAFTPLRPCRSTLPRYEPHGVCLLLQGPQSRMTFLACDWWVGGPHAVSPAGRRHVPGHPQLGGRNPTAQVLRPEPRFLSPAHPHSWPVAPASQDTSNPTTSHPLPGPAPPCPPPGGCSSLCPGLPVSSLTHTEARGVLL